MPRPPGPICVSELGAGWIDKGTSALTQHASPTPFLHTDAQRAIQLPGDVPGRLLLAAQCGLPQLAPEIRRQLAPLLSLEGMAVVAGSVLAVGAAHAIGVGFAVDILFGALTITLIGADAVEAARHGKRFYSIAVNAANEEEFERAGREFAAFVSLIGINAVILLMTKGRARSQAQRPIASLGTTRAAWLTYINRIEFKVPGGKGALWSRIDPDRAESLARGKGLVTLEMVLKEEGFMDLYMKQFGTFDEVKAKGLEAVTAEIWTVLSERYAASLEGRVVAFVNQPSLSNAVAGGREPFIVDELWRISEVMQKNSRISSVQLIDVSTGGSSIMLREQVLRATRDSF